LPVPTRTIRIGSERRDAMIEEVCKIVLDDIVHVPLHH
jgi:hypothetical protein